MTATAGAPTRKIACRFGQHETASLERIDEEPAATSSWFNVAITTPLLERISGDELTIPWLRNAGRTCPSPSTRRRFIRHFGSERGWHIRFGRELNATDDKNAFHPAGRGLR